MSNEVDLYSALVPNAPGWQALAENLALHLNAASWHQSWHLRYIFG